MQKSLVPPSGDKHDYYTVGGYTWPCTTTCEEAGFSEEKCKSWDAGLRTFGPCDNSTGLPWVNRDGFLNPEGDEDLMALIVMADTVETLTLAWWFAPSSNESTAFAKAAARAVRAWFVDQDTRQSPHMEYASAIPGHYNGTAGGMIALTFRLNSRLFDCIELLRTAGPEVWSGADDAGWMEWATAWHRWLTTSVFGEHELAAVNNHGTFLFIHRIALAAMLGDTGAILEDVGRLRSGLAGSLTEQILPSGEMPIETNRVTGATYSRMNLKGLYELGVVVENACEGLACEPRWDWSWEATEASQPRWEKHDGLISYCSYRGAGSTASVQQCQADCLAFTDAPCNGVVTRHKFGTMVGCYFKQCAGTVYKLEPKDDGDTGEYDTYMYVQGPDVGSGSVKRALDYLLPYARQEKSWLADYPESIDSDYSWRDMALPLRVAARAFNETGYEADIAAVDPDGSGLRFFGLLFPPADFMASS